MTPAKPYRCDLCVRCFKTDAALADHRRDSHGVRNPDAPSAATLDPACIECGMTARLVGGDTIYPHRPDLYGKRFWLCRCGAYCGCHGVTSRPLGFPAGPETRRARNNAHATFDPLWRSGRMTRREAYSWLADRLGIDCEDCHIGMMTAERARQVVVHVNALRMDRAA